ncbi:hypothetical protein [Micromonospora sp. NPDC023633]
MIRLPRRLHGQPRFPMTGAGHGRIRHEHLPAKTQQSLRHFVATAF